MADTGIERDFPLDLAVEIEAGGWPSPEQLETLTRRAIAASISEAGIVLPRGTELGVTFTDDNHIAALNARWRDKPGPTNVLSFPIIDPQPDVTLPPMLGDIVIAFETVAREAEEQGKPFPDHLTHLVVHGFLHLMGHDHLDDEEAREMESLERQILERLAIPDPYA